MDKTGKLMLIGITGAALAGGYFLYTKSKKGGSDSANNQLGDIGEIQAETQNDGDGGGVGYDSNYNSMSDMISDLQSQMNDLRYADSINSSFGNYAAYRSVTSGQEVDLSKQTAANSPDRFAMAAGGQIVDTYKMQSINSDVMKERQQESNYFGGGFSNPAQNASYGRVASTNNMSSMTSNLNNSIKNFGFVEAMKNYALGSRAATKDVSSLASASNTQPSGSSRSSGKRYSTDKISKKTGNMSVSSTKARIARSKAATAKKKAAGGYN